MKQTSGYRARPLLVPRVLVTLLVVVASGSVRPIVAQEASGAEEAEAVLGTGGAHPLRPGDAIRVELGLEPDLSGEYQIDERGAVQLPILGSRRVTETPADRLKSELLEAYGEQLRNQSIAVTLLRRVRVLGAVKEPGIYLVDPTMTLADVIALAGGATPEGKTDGIRIIREGEEVELGDYGPFVGAERLQSGDQVLVPQRSWLSRNTGVVIGALVSTLGFVVSVAVF